MLISVQPSPQSEGSQSGPADDAQPLGGGEDGVVMVAVAMIASADTHDEAGKDTVLVPIQPQVTTAESPETQKTKLDLKVSKPIEFQNVATDPNAPKLAESDKPRVLTKPIDLEIAQRLKENFAEWSVMGENGSVIEKSKLEKIAMENPADGNYSEEQIYVARAIIGNPEMFGLMDDSDGVLKLDNWISEKAIGIVRGAISEAQRSQSTDLEIALPGQSSFDVNRLGVSR